jgi:hypothetical protein
MYQTRGVIKTTEKRIVPGLKFKWSESTPTSFKEVFLRLYNDQQFTYSSLTQQKEKNQILSTNSTTYYGTWEILEETEQETKVRTIPQRFQPNPTEEITTINFSISPSIKKPKTATREKMELKYISRESREESERLPLMVVRDIVHEKPTRPIVAVVTGQPKLLRRSSAAYGQDFDDNPNVGAVDSSFFCTQKIEQEENQYIQPIRTIMPIPNIKQMAIFHETLYVLTEEGTIFTNNAKYHITEDDQPIDFILFKYFQKRDRYYINQYITAQKDKFAITRSGELYVEGYNIGGKYGLGHLVTVRDFTRVPLPENEIAVKVATSKTHSVLLLYNTVEKRIVVRTAGKSDHYALGTGTVQNLNFVEIPSEHFNNLWIKDVACGTHFSYYLSDSGVLFANGLNSRGQCAVPGLAPITRPRKVYEGVKQVQCRGKNTLILTEAGRVCIAGPAYGLYNCSFYRLPVPEYFRLANICLGKHYFLFTTDMHEVFALRDTKAKGIDAQTFVRAHHLAEKQTMLIQHPCIDALVQQNNKSLQVQMKILSDGFQSVAYFTKPEGVIKNLFSVLWKAFSGEKLVDLTIVVG